MMEGKQATKNMDYVGFKPGHAVASFRIFDGSFSPNSTPWQSFVVKSKLIQLPAAQLTVFFHFFLLVFC